LSTILFLKGALKILSRTSKNTF